MPQIDGPAIKNLSASDRSIADMLELFGLLYRYSLFYSILLSKNCIKIYVLVSKNCLFTFVKCLKIIDRRLKNFQRVTRRLRTCLNSSGFYISEGVLEEYILVKESMNHF